MFLDKLNAIHPSIKYVKRKQQNQKNINNLFNELLNSNILNKLHTSPSADPNSNYNIMYSIIENSPK